MTPPERRSRATEGFFGRRRGKTIRAIPRAALDGGLGRYRLDLAAPAPANLSSLFEAPVEAVRLEIGFGGGENLLREAAAHPATGFIGVEPFVNCIAKLCARSTPL